MSTRLLLVLTIITQCYAQNNALNDLDDLLKNSEIFEIPSYETCEEDRGPFDYIVVGAGTAGSVLASRLSENPSIKILLLEAGDSPSRVTEIPFAAPTLQLSEYNWDYVLEKQNNFNLGMVNNQMHWPRGKSVGGSSTINSMIHCRGNKHDYDRWASMGNPGWSYEDVLPYFFKSENSRLKFQDRGYHNNNGYLNVQYPYRTKSALVFVKAAMELGYPYVDYNGNSQMGVSFIQATLRDGHRCSTEKAFLRPAKHRKNLVIRKNSFVTQILIDGATKTAYGVKYLNNNTTFLVNARKEVILSAGVLRSPQILMLSGVGPRDDLEKMKIPLVKDLPVGKKIYDHPSYLGLVFAVNKKIVSVFNDFVANKTVERFMFNGTGPLTSTDLIESVLFMKTSVADYKEFYPDIELMFLSSSMNLDETLIYKRMVNIADKFYDSVWKSIKEKLTFSIFPILLHQKSHGHLRLKSKNPFDAVTIYGNYFTDPQNKDMKTMIAGIREAQRIIQAPAFRYYETRQVENIVPGCKHLRYDSDPYWECAIRHITNTMHHQTSTCKMGPVSDPESVVDHKLRVHGIKKLRVVDTSIIPIPLSAHTNIPTVMIGEKASQLILEDYHRFT
ncbi:hypothetical protein FQR65_LT05021 [Abscondita terminalis]|nr:hypothetical protein FQR65_LT05021 [Abscondita terminalis]